MATIPCMTRPKTEVVNIINKVSQERGWSLSLTIANILFEVVINKRIPVYLSE